MHIEQYMDVVKLEQYIKDGIVDVRYHPFLPIKILCYSRRATYENIWDDITIKCRGLIVDEGGRIVSRAFEKFFNAGTHDRPETWLTNLPKEQPIVLEKLDGSLGVLYSYPNPDGKSVIEGVASKGSFISEHAKWASEWYAKNCKNPQWPEGYTPVFEMICQSVQRHVVSYDIPDQLILLALVNNETGEELSYNEVYHYAFLNGLKTADIFAKSVGTVLDEDRDNKEGYVLSWPRPGKTPLKVKVKHETFLKLQKIVHNATPKAILDLLEAKQFETIDEWKDSASPELAEFVERWSALLCEMYARTLREARSIVDNGMLRYSDQETARKNIAGFFLQENNKRYASIAFAILDGKDPSKPAWKIVREEFNEELHRPVMGDPDDDLDEVERHDGNPYSYHPSKEAVCQ